MNWVDEHNFVISINFHGGSVVVSYPYDGSPNGRASYSKFFIYLLFILFYFILFFFFSYLWLIYLFSV